MGKTENAIGSPKRNWTQEPWFSLGWLQLGTKLTEAHAINLDFRYWILEAKARFGFRLCENVWKASEDAAKVKEVRVRRLMCVESFVLFRFAHLSLTRSKYPCWPPTHTQTHRHTPSLCIPDGQITGHGKTICSRDSITYKHRHPAGLCWDEIVYFRSLLSHTYLILREQAGVGQLVAFGVICVDMKTSWRLNMKWRPHHINVRLNMTDKVGRRLSSASPIV